MRARPCKKVLIVHTDRRLCLLLKLRFERKGFEAFLAHTEEGFRNHVFFQKPDLILLAMQLDRRSGLEIYEWLVTLGLDAAIPVIGLGGGAEGRPLLRARRGRSFAHYRRPFNARRIAHDSLRLLAA